MSADVPSAPPEPSATSELLGRRRLALVLVVLLVEIGLFFVGLFTPLSASTQQYLANQANSTFGSVLGAPAPEVAAFIFTHNLAIALSEMIPVAGVLLFALSIYSTGLAAQALVVVRGLPAQWGAVVFAFPYTLVELSAYAVAIVAGSMLLVAWRRGHLRRELKVFALEGVSVAGILLTAAAMEAATGVSVVLGFALWLPTGLALAAVIILAARKP